MFVYEILIRGDEKGLRGIHQILGRVVTDSEGESHVKLGKAEAISVENLASMLNESLAVLLKNLDDKTQDLQQIEEKAKELARKTEEAIVALQVLNTTEVYAK